MLATFIDRYVDTDNPGDPRFDALVRVVVDQRPALGDGDALADLRRDPGAVNAFSLYLRAKSHHGAIVTLTEEGDLVLGLEIDDPLDDPEVVVEAARADLRSHERVPRHSQPCGRRAPASSVRP